MARVMEKETRLGTETVIATEIGLARGWVRAKDYVTGTRTARGLETMRH